jgi:hypothetical protein
MVCKACYSSGINHTFAVVGTWFSAVVYFGFYEDVGLLVAGITSLAMLTYQHKSVKQSTVKPVN